MAEYIEREAALNATFKIHVKLLDRRIKTAQDAVQAYANYIAYLPAADVQPVTHGRWVINHYPVAECQVCKHLTDISHLTSINYCPNCGARMDGGEDGS